jgi:ATP adenylyltransferase
MKPQDLKKSVSSGPKPPKVDPFENPSPELLLASFPPQNPTHALVLNKFPVIPNHFILATKAWKAQTDLLETADLEATYECLRSWTDGSTSPTNGNPNRLFAFFNSGEDSGASQPHRHLQFLPVEAMHQPGTESWTPLIDLLTTQPHTSQSFQSHPSLPFTHFALPLPKNPTPEKLHAIYIALYRAAVGAVRGREPRDGLPSIATNGPSAISYNLAMTLETMMIAPRRAETARVPVDIAAAGDIADPGVVSLNGTILAGTLMVKAEGEWDVLRAKPEVLGRLLRDVGIPGTGHASL